VAGRHGRRRALSAGGHPDLGAGGLDDVCRWRADTAPACRLFADVRDVLPAHQGHFVVSDSGPVTARDGNVFQQDFGIATLVHARTPLIGAASTFVHGACTTHVHWAVHDRPRVAHAVRVIDRPNGMSAVVVHLHGLRDPAGKGDTAARRAQAERLAAFVSSVRDAGDLVVVYGDLNLLPHSETFDVLADIGLTDLVGDADTRTSLYAKPLRHARYMLVSAPSHVRRFEIVRAPEVSDHRALLIEF
jgi:endonuclease/exonuclease/phosphatase (EEP) superfamily protein YafD